MLIRIQKSKFSKILAAYIAISFLGELIAPNVALALTGGPSQPEVQSFEPVGTSEMVDLFSGDFNYNIPLMDVGGYPINISYHSGITMDQEASWVGLGWNINPGVINRNMRGIPDDFKGDKIDKELNMKPNRTVGVSGSVSAEFFGVDNLGSTFGYGINYNNYTGIGFEKIFNISFSSGDPAKGQFTGGLGIKSGSDGLSLSPSVSFDARVSDECNKDQFIGASLGSSFNSRAGIKSLSIGVSYEKGNDYTHRGNKYYAKGHGSGEIGSSISFGMSTYVPTINMPMVNTSITLAVKAGGHFMGLDATYGFSGYYSEQQLRQKSSSVSAFGYLNMDEGSKNTTDVALDFNREKDGAFSLNTPALPLTNFTYDVYSVSGQGIGGMYRPFRSDLGYVYDSHMANTTNSYSLGGELNVGNLAHSGVDVSFTDVNTNTDSWTEDNEVVNKLKFRGQQADDLYEPYYFKEAGEKSVDSEPALFASIGEFDPVRIGLQNSGGFNCRTTDMFIRQTSPETTTEVAIPDADNNYRKQRQKRNQSISLLSIAEARNFGLQPGLYSTTPSNSTVYSGAKEYHIGEVTTLRTDGSRYVYGIPAYNTQQEETTFSMGAAATISSTPPVADCNKGLISYNPDVDNTVSNKKGQDNYFSNTILPAYAHSYLLTAVLSPDYVDIDNIKGPSSGDLGTYTRFNYSKNSNYKWRVPVDENKANYNENLKTDNADDQGNYIYGEKELWYLNSIESKNYIAIFEKDDRKDALGVAGKNGGWSSSVPSKLLKKISLYSKPDYDANTVEGIPTTAVPIKEVHFVYDYSLCQDAGNKVPNNNLSTTLNSAETDNQGGKLTLKKIYFTYGKSKKAKLSPYEFTYSSFNPSYNLKGYDRWGNYKPNNINECAILPTTPVATSEFPYVDQNKTTADEYTSAWSLKTINLPSGGTINVTYESDDYAYVQNKQAMQMFKISNCTGEVPTAANVEGSSPLSLFDGNTSNRYLCIKLQESIANDANSTNIFRKKYLTGIDNLYFKFYTNVNQNGYEYVSGYIKIEDSGLITPVSGNYQYGWIKLKPVSKEKNGTLDENPISKAAWQFARLHTPWAYGFSAPNPDLGVEDIFNALADASVIKNVVQTFQGPNGALKNNVFGGFGRLFHKERSFIRLLNPTKKKLGGGSRVKQLTISDEWDKMAAGQNTDNFEYGQLYDYTKKEDGVDISAGVAAYEPMLGGDENPFKQPVPFGNEEEWYEKMLVPHNDVYLEEPFGESFFPAAGVGYSHVTVKNLQHSGVTRNATGSVVHKFYTAYDFPIITRRTALDPRSQKTNPILKLFKINMKDYMTASQGYSIELNDMHGKPMGQEVYAEGQTTPISKVEYFYKTSGNRLDNQVAVINNDGNIENKMVGVDYDFIADMRQQKTDVLSAGLNVNLSVFVVGIFPGIVPTIFPSFSNEHTRFRSAVTTKVINRYGILVETKATDLGSTVSTQNLAYDAQTGNVLLTKTANEFNDEIYTFSYPAHWQYNLMGPAYKNVGASVYLNYTGTDGKYDFSGEENKFFTPGDEVIVKSSYNEKKAWVAEVTGTYVKMIRENGQPYEVYAENVLAKIIRSGRKNQQETPIGNVTCLKNPIDKDGDGNINYNQKFDFDYSYGILNAGAVEFSDSWHTFCDCLTQEAVLAGKATQGRSGSVVGSNNPYQLGLKGNWKAQKSHLYLTQRLQANLNNNTSIRNDGTFQEFSPFWKYNAVDGLWQKNAANWTFTSEVTEFSPYNIELENKDALNRYSAAQYGYNNSLPVAVSSNSQYKETGFDNFEDYAYGTCASGHFSFKDAGPVISETESHTGTKSIKVTANNSISITKPLLPCNPQ